MRDDSEPRQHDEQIRLAQWLISVDGVNRQRD